MILTTVPVNGDAWEGGEEGRISLPFPLQLVKISESEKRDGLLLVPPLPRDLSK
jgi:hypothetical protein